MRRFLAGTAMGLLIGLAAGAGGAGLLGLGPSGANSRFAERATAPVPDGGDVGPPSVPADGRPARPKTRRALLRPGRTRVAPRESGPRSEKPTPEPTPVKAPVVPTAELRHRLEAALLPGRQIGSEFPPLAAALAARTDARPLPLELVELALAKAESSGDVGADAATALVKGIAPDDAAAALRAALDGNEKLLWIAEALIARAASTDGFDPDVLAIEMLRHPSAEARSAGVYVSQYSETPPVDELVRVATTDSDAETRDWAMSILTSLSTESDDPATRERIVPIVLMTALEGSADARMEAISQFEEIGPPAADTALRLLAEGGLDEELTYHVVRPILEAGRLTELLSVELEEPTASAIVWWIEEADEDDDRLSACLPHAAQIYGMCDDDAAESLMYVLVSLGHLDTIDLIASRELASREKRRIVIAQLSSGGDLPEEREEEVELRAVRILRRYLDPSLSTVRQRLEIARAAAEGEFNFWHERGVLGAIAVLQNAARTDPNSWVRSHATEAVDSLRTNLE